MVVCAAQGRSLQKAVPGAMAGGSYSPALHVCWMQAGSLAGTCCPDTLQANWLAAPQACTENAHHAAQLWFPHLCPGPFQRPRGRASSQHRDYQARLGTSGFDCWGVKEFWGFGGFTTHVRAWPAASSLLAYSGFWGGCSGFGPRWLVPFAVKLFMIHVLPWYHFPLKTWASDPACLPPKHLEKCPAACSPFTSDLHADSTICHQPLPRSLGSWPRCQWLEWLTVSGSLGEETTARWYPQHAWEGVCMPHVDTCTALAYGLTRVRLWVGV